MPLHACACLLLLPSLAPRMRKSCTRSLGFVHLAARSVKIFAPAKISARHPALPLACRVPRARRNQPRRSRARGARGGGRLRARHRAAACGAGGRRRRGLGGFGLGVLCITRPCSDTTRLHTAPYGSVRFHMVPHGSIRVPCGSTRFHTVPHGSTRFHTVPDGSRQFHGSIRFHTVPYGSTRFHAWFLTRPCARALGGMPETSSCIALARSLRGPRQAARSATGVQLMRI